MIGNVFNKVKGQVWPTVLAASAKKEYNIFEGTNKNVPEQIVA